MEGRLSASLGLPCPSTSHHPIPSEFATLFAHFTSLVVSPPTPARAPKAAAAEAASKVGAVMYGGVAAMVKQILKEEGLVGFTRGMGPRVVHSACFSAIGYFAFETARLTILHQYLKRKESLELEAVAPSS